MVKRKSLWVLAIAGMVMTGQSQAVAQESLELSILDGGLAPSSSISISAVVSGQKVQLGRTGAAGTTSVPFDMLNLSKGTPVGINLVRDQGTTEVVLLPPGEVSDECDRARQDPNGDCRKLGTTYWLETRAAVIDLAEGGSLAITYTAAAETTASTSSSLTQTAEGLLEGSSRPRLGLSMTWSNFTNLESTACNQSGIGNCTADDSGIGFSAYYEFGNLWPGRPFFAGIGGGFKSVSVTQSFPTFGSNVIDLDIWQIDAYGGWRFPFANQFEAFPMIGFSWMFNSGDIATDFATSASESRSESGLRMLFGAGLDWEFADRVDLRGTIRYLVGGSDDADTNWELGAGINYKF